MADLDAAEIRAWMRTTGRDYKAAADHHGASVGEVRVLLGLPLRGRVGRWALYRTDVLAWLLENPTCGGMVAAHELRPAEVVTDKAFRSWVAQCGSWATRANKLPPRKRAKRRAGKPKPRPPKPPKGGPAELEAQARWHPEMLASAEYWTELIDRLEVRVDICWQDGQRNTAEKLIARQMAARRELDGIEAGQRKAPETFDDMTPAELIEVLVETIADPSFPIRVVDAVQAACEDRRKPMFEVIEGGG